MEIRLQQETDGLTLFFNGRLDTSTAEATRKEIHELLAEQKEVKGLTCDLAEMDYISSTGLRILLGLAQRYKPFRLTEVQPEVFSVLEMTGFSKMMTVEKALRTMSIDGCPVIGQGGVGTVYRIDDDTIIKVFREGTTMEEVRGEITMSKEAFVLGMPTAISFDIVRVGSQYGLVYELLDADTLSACVRREPDRMDEFAAKYAGLFKQMHAISVPADSGIPSAMDHEREAIQHIRRYFSDEDIALMMHIVDAIPPGDRLLHLDLQSKNAMMQGDELMLIDMGEMGYGHPMLDLGHAYSPMMALVGDYEAITGMPEEMTHTLWQRMTDHYFADLSPEMRAHREEQMMVVSKVRNFSWLSLSDSFPEALIHSCQELFDERVRKQKDYIYNVCETFSDWTLE